MARKLPAAYKQGPPPFLSSPQGVTSRPMPVVIKKTQPAEPMPDSSLPPDVSVTGMRPVGSKGGGKPPSDSGKTSNKTGTAAHLY